MDHDRFFGCFQKRDDALHAQDTGPVQDAHGFAKDGQLCLANRLGRENGEGLDALAAMGGSGFFRPDPPEQGGFIQVDGIEAMREQRAGISRFSGRKPRRILVDAGSRQFRGGALMGGCDIRLCQDEGICERDLPPRFCM